MTDAVGFPVADALERVLEDIDRLVAIVAADVGEPPEAVRATVEHATRLLGDRPGPAGAAQEMVAAGIAAARAGVPRPQLIDRYLTTAWAVWEAVTTDPDVTREELTDLGGRLLHGVDITAAALAEGYATVDRETIERDARARLAFLQELLGAVAADRIGRSRIRRLATRYGLDPDGAYQLVGLAVGDRSEPADTDERLSRAAAVAGPPSAAERARGGLTLPQVLGWRGWLIVVAHPGWAGLERLRSAMPDLVPDRPWTAIVASPVQGIAELPASLSVLTEALRAAELVGHRGWQSGPGAMAVEELLIADRALTEAAVAHELGPILADERMGEELLLTLEAYLATGSNMRETARRLHLAHRTVAYRLERIEQLLGRSIEGPEHARLAVALLGWRSLRAI
ncbi:MAG: helix-turn-helix domain-containing protein [Chloroflexota bacterium]